MSNGPFAAVLLAGGRSRRMGRDKAMLPLPDGRRLWERQLAVLRALEPAELFISGPAREGFPADVTLLTDDQPDLGPLSGVATALKTIRSTRLVVLAVDLPVMTTGFLRELLTHCRKTDVDLGIIPRTADRFYEPLAAIYPREALAVAENQLRGEDRSLQTFVRTLHQKKLVTALSLQKADARLFMNWNEPRDLRP